MAGTDAAERLLNLIIALSNAQVRMSRAQIRAQVAGYDKERPGDDEATARKRTQAFERMFERDKDDLRKMGVRLVTVTDATHGDDIGYVIDRGASQMPAVELTAAERAVLTAAAGYWRSAELRDASGTALTKLSSTSPRERRLDSRAVGLGPDGDHIAALSQAAADRQVVTFEYDSAASGRAKREVEPWKIVAKGSAVYLLARDRKRGEPRTFRLSRIVGKPRVTGEPGAYAVPKHTGEVGALTGSTGSTAIVHLRPEAGHALRERGKLTGTSDGWDVVEVPFADVGALRDEVLALTGSARAVAPDFFVDAVLEHARAAVGVARG